MTEITNIYLTRHASTDLNAQKIMQGLIDSELSEAGRREAAFLAADLADMKLDAIYTSDLKRAAATAEIIAAAQKGEVPVIHDQRLREINSGKFQGRTYDDCRELDPYNWELAALDPLSYHPPGGEPGLHIQQRMQALLDEVVETYPGGNILLVSHGFSIKALTYPYVKENYADLATTRKPGQVYQVLDNTALLHFRHDPEEGFILVSRDAP
ncbi:MAG: histidine phosphatase family protein [Clostridiaceae bacterium]|jgi:broad specificity phosphatase PhoE|nr:histidine phosphatase family protein [Clostridiaceae bacterium]